MQEIILSSEDKIKNFKNTKKRYLVEDLDLNEKII